MAVLTTLKTKSKRKHIHIIAAFLLFAAFIAVLLFGGVGVSYAATTNYSNVLDDLRKDESFDFNAYPNVSDDYSLQVIQIAESTNGELFLYVYQPAGIVKPLTATRVNMSLSESVDGTTLFNLTLLNREGVLCKYRVDGVRVSSEEERFYNITTIYRTYDESLGDDGSTTESIITEKAYNVDKLYKAVTEDGVISYFSKDTETVKIINPFFDFLRYSNGFKLYKDSCDSHYVAFSTDKQIDTLLEATVTYSSQSCTNRMGSKSYGTKYEHTVNLTGEQTGSNSANGWFAHQYEWERIQSVEEFTLTEDLTQSAYDKVCNSQWVLRFCETDYKWYRPPASPGGYYVEEYTEISNVTILRLKFETAGKTYNLGAVSDIGHADTTPGNNNTEELGSLGEVTDRFLKKAFHFAKDTFKFVSDWLADMLGIPNVFGKVLAAILFIIVFVLVVVIIVSLVRLIPPKKGGKSRR